MDSSSYIAQYGDFYGILSLGANLQYVSPAEGGVTTAANRSDIEMQISVYEPEYLALMFGTDFRDALYDYYHSETQEEERFDTLLSLLKGEESGVSPVAAYIYFRVLETRNTQVAETGVSVSAGEGAASCIPHQVQAWSVMVKANRAIYDYCVSEFSDYDIETHKTMLESVNSLGV